MRSRGRKIAHVLKRVTFTVQSNIADWISGMISQIVSCYACGRTPMLRVAVAGIKPPVIRLRQAGSFPPRRSVHPRVGGEQGLPEFANGTNNGSLPRDKQDEIPHQSG